VITGQRPLAGSDLRLRSDAVPILSLRSVARSFGATKAVDGVTLDIPQGEFFTIVGPSGSGKSTLIRMLAGLDRPTSGDILLRGQRINDMPANLRPTCMVFQSLALFSHMSVGQNIEFALTMRRVKRAERRLRCESLMDLVRLPREFYRKSVLDCSGGERQRVALARALASDPEILFFDEPLSAIDYRLRKVLEMEMKDLHRATGKTFLYITHSLEEAMVMSDRIAVMREGRIVQTGDPLTIYRHPGSRFVAEFMGEVNLLKLTRDGNNWRLPELGFALASPPRNASEGWIVLRPESLRVLERETRADVEFEGELLNDYVLGSRTQVLLRSGEKTFISEVGGNLTPPPTGATIRVGFNLADAVVVTE
jgi:spermidine/putrescine transport system ATP-binding protein